jgi:hypothetical protein
VNSSVLTWIVRPERPAPFAAIAQLVTNRDWFTATSALFHRFDHLLEVVLDRRHTWHVPFVTDYASRTSHPAPIVTFPLHPKPHDVVDSDPWVRDHWV